MEDINKLEKTFAIRFKQQKLQLIFKAAEKENMTASSFIRKVVLDAAIKSLEKPAEVQENDLL